MTLQTRGANSSERREVPTMKEPGKGTELGLSTIYTIIGKYSGDIKVESKVGTGGK